MKRYCKNCGKDISHKHINAKFCGLRCKDNFHNWNNPRGRYSYLKNENPTTWDIDRETHPQDPDALGQD